MSAAACRKCHRPTRPSHRVRGLCRTCEEVERDAGRIGKWPRITRPWADTVAAAERVRTERPELQWQEIAAEIGVSPHVLDRARRGIYGSLRALAAAVPRSEPTPLPPPRFDLVDTEEL